MFFSVIVPVYNVKQYVRKCIESLLNQKHNDYEIILVDDGSTDGSGVICDEYQKKASNVKVIHQTNKGLVQARKAGLRLAEGEYIVPVDGDDWVSEYYLYRMNEIIEQRHVDMVMVGFFHAFQKGLVKGDLGFDSGEYQLERIVKEIFPHLLRDERGKYFKPNLWGKAFQRQFYIECQSAVDDRISNGEDAAVTYPVMTKIHSLFLCDEPLYYYRKNETSMLHSRKKGIPWDNCDYLFNILKSGMGLDYYDFRKQMDRFISHAMFNVVKSHFQTEKKFKLVKKEAIVWLGKNENRDFLKRAEFSLFSKDYFANFALSKRILVLIWLFGKLEK